MTPIICKPQYAYTYSKFIHSILDSIPKWNILILFAGIHSTYWPSLLWSALSNPNVVTSGRVQKVSSECGQSIKRLKSLKNGSKKGCRTHHFPTRSDGRQNPPRLPKPRHKCLLNENPFATFIGLTCVLKLWINCYKNNKVNISLIKSQL